MQLQTVEDYFILRCFLVEPFGLRLSEPRRKVILPLMQKKALTEYIRCFVRAFQYYLVWNSLK